MTPGGVVGVVVSIVVGLVVVVVAPVVDDAVVVIVGTEVVCFMVVVVLCFVVDIVVCAVDGAVAVDRVVDDVEDVVVVVITVVGVAGVVGPEIVAVGVAVVNGFDAFVKTSSSTLYRYSSFSSLSFVPTAFFAPLDLPFHK